MKTTEQRTVVGVNREEIKGTQEYIEKYFPIVKASTLHLDDEFLKHEPTTKKQTRFKKALLSAIKLGLSDFRAQRMDASFDEEGNICFKVGMTPAAMPFPQYYWKKVAEDFMPEKGSRLGTRKERIAFVALLIKYLIEEEGYAVSDAWKAVCDQSKDLGYYWDSKNAKHDIVETTGSWQVGEWYDLANTFKIIVDDETGEPLIAGGFCDDEGNIYPLADINSFDGSVCDYDVSVGWFVLSV